ncbi:hypothetical protein HYALB_00001633 [Hymenoscyphus albidus]|uniref:2EXR domain-containing protein n=1 Tax=Hymenoscyphus albidus TaxID=595503 RepID=A0A9N9LFJ5_9HELO|nr:hypothetical protein HYALB_00001633 [Hymenoscyphus albidus]
MQAIMSYIGGMLTYMTILANGINDLKLMKNGQDRHLLNLEPRYVSLTFQRVAVDTDETLEDWEIVPQPTRPSGKPCHGNFTNSQEFSKVEWPEEVPSFSRFSELACELQIQIWEYALPGPGIIDLHIQQRRGQGFCSHEIWLQLQPPVIYINKAYDTLILDCNVLQRFEAQGGHMDLSKLQHLALKEFGMAAISAHIYLEKTLPSLKTITHILNHDILSTKNVKTLRDFGFRGRMSKSPKHNFQLINVGGSLERSDIFWENSESVLQSDFSGSPKRVLKRWWKTMEKWSSEVLYLIPRGKENDKNDDIAYYTLRPKAPYKKRTPRLLIEDERWELDRRYGSQRRIVAQKHFGFFLNPRGQYLEGLYDGIPALFGEEVPEESEAQNELVFTAKCD